MRGPALIVEDDLGEYLGEVEPRYGLRLTELMRGGNIYTAAIASMREDSVRVMIKEVFQQPSQTGRLSFPPRALDDFRPYFRDTLIKHELEDEEEVLEEE